jgi:hypothetical protein
MKIFPITMSLCLAVFASEKIAAQQQCELTLHELQQVLGVDAIMLHADLKKGQKLGFSYVEYDADLQKVTKTLVADMPLAGPWGFAKSGPATVDYKLVLHEGSLSLIHKGIKSSPTIAMPAEWAKEILQDFRVLVPNLISLKRMSINKDGRFMLSK